ncbi:Hypothetical_protein [Hexamita inflata]|uniref:Hypothetical_protein n=1 Tax=Hexamita inflata TaxID=28002 RepID=A0AA86PWP7_9EUKA|nr:Hypothetical protein HINF_LOCUS35091 [Hexamita inflata]
MLLVASRSSPFHNSQIESNLFFESQTLLPQATTGVTECFLGALNVHGQDHFTTEPYPYLWNLISIYQKSKCFVNHSTLQCLEVLPNLDTKAMNQTHNGRHNFAASLAIDTSSTIHEHFLKCCVYLYVDQYNTQHCKKLFPYRS